MGRKINTFSKAIKHLKSSKYDMLEAAPTNNTMGFMSKDVHGFDTELSPDTRTYASPDFTQDDSPDDTSGLFEADGTPKTAMPPGDISYILGPMSAMWYAWGNFTAIGYIKESDRKMMNLGTITGQLGSWDQETFISYGQLTLEQLQWFYNVKKYNNADNDTPNYRAFYPGPPSNTPDEHGRYYCVITGEPKQTGGSGPINGPQPPTPGSWEPGDPYPNDKGKGDKKDPQDELNNKYGHLSDEELADLGYKRNANGDIEEMTDEEKQEHEDEKTLREWRRKMADKFRKIFPHMNDTQLVNHLKKVGLWDQMYKVAEPNKAFEKGIDSAMAAAGRALRLKSASNMLTKYDDWLRGGAPGTVDVTDQIQQSSMNRLVKSVNSTEVQSVIQKAIDIANGPNANNPVRVTGISNAKTLADLQWELAADAVTKKLQKTVHGSLDLDNTLHNNVQIDKELFKQSGGKEIVIVKTYQFRPGGSVAKAEDSPVGKFLMGMGIELDTMATGPVGWLGVAASMMGLRGSMMYGGNYSAPGMPMRINVKSGAGEKPKPSPWDVKNFKGGMYNSYEPGGQVLSESRKTQILKNLKSPVVIPEEQKKFKVKPKIRGLKTVVSKPVETPKEYKKIGGRNLWGKAEYDYNTRQSQERKNETLELLGASDHHWEYMTETSKKKNAEEMAKFYGDHPDLYTYTFGGKKQKVLRKEQLKGDYLVFLVDENGVKTNMLQSKLNEKLAEQDEKRMLDEYNKINPKPKEPISFEKDYMFKKAYQRLKPQVDYKDKPAKKGYPNDPPPEMVNYRHPDFDKRPGTSYYNKLDPQSAAAMPKQDDPTIDAKVQQAKENPKKDSAIFRRKLDDKMKNEREKFNK